MICTVYLHIGVLTGNTLVSLFEFYPYCVWKLVNVHIYQIVNVHFTFQSHYLYANT